MKAILHHIEMCVQNGNKMVEKLKAFGFSLFATRTTVTCQQFVVRCNRNYLIVTEKINKDLDVNNEDWTVFCCERDHQRDRVFNVALLISNVEEVTDKVKRSGMVIIRVPSTIVSEEGQVTYSIVQSQCHNVVHTLINKGQAKAHSFLPGFITVTQSPTATMGRIKYVDHVTLACFYGQTEDIIQWYQNIFGMKRFMINRNEDENRGLVIDVYGISMRLKAMEYWRCSEVGLVSCDPLNPNKNKLILVIVEPLNDEVTCNINMFLREHDGPGIEHVALYTPNILQTVENMVENGVEFRYPPSGYYKQIDKIQETTEVGEDIHKLSQFGILLDSEIDHEAGDDRDDNKKFLMQIFSHPIFTRRTFFFEVIQRRGARGFGAGNITALANSIKEEEMKKLKMNH